MSPQTHTKAPTKKESFLTQYALGLLNYADTDSLFAESLAYHIQAQGWRSIIAITENSAAQYVTPNDRDNAIVTASWLLAELNTSNISYTKGMLATWASNYESPKDIVIGIVGLAIIGPTLGLIKSTKKKKGMMQIVIDKQWHDTSIEEDRIELVQTLSQQVVAGELSLAGGNTYRLHPDTAEWLMTDPQTKLFIEDRHTINNLRASAKTENLSHTIKTKNDRVIAIAISPAVNDSFVKEFVD